MGHGLERFHQVQQGLSVVLCCKARPLADKRGLPSRHLGVAPQPSKDAWEPVGVLPCSCCDDARPHPQPDEGGEQANWTEPAVRFGQQHDQDEVQHFPPNPPALARHEDASQCEHRLGGEAEEGPRRGVVAAEARARRERGSRRGKRLRRQACRVVQWPWRLESRVAGTFLPQGRPLVGFKLDCSLVRERG